MLRILPHNRFFKIIITIYIFFILIGCVNGDENDIHEYIDFGCRVEIGADYFLYENIAGFEGIPERIELYGYESIFNSNIPFFFSEVDKEKLLVLKNDDILLVYSAYTSYALISGIIKDKYKSEGLVTPWNIESSSFLIEGKTSYSPENLEYLQMNSPWVEGVKGYGIGEWIQFDLGPFSGIYIINGYLSFSRPDLYLKNSRVKEIQIKDLITNAETTMYLEDSPQPQYLDLSSHKDHTIRLVIKDIYPGTVYEDTCITSILLRDF